MCALRTLHDRREKRSLSFALKSSIHKTNSSMFPLNPVQDTHSVRNHEKFLVNKARTESYRKSTIPYLQRRLNQYTEKLLELRRRASKRTPMSAYVSLFQPSHAFSSLFKPIPAYWSYLELFGAIWSHWEPVGAIWCHFKPLEAIRSHLESFKPFGAFLSYFEPTGAIESYFKPFGAFLRNLELFGNILSDLDQFGKIWSAHFRGPPPLLGNVQKVLKGGALLFLIHFWGGGGAKAPYHSKSFQIGPNHFKCFQTVPNFSKMLQKA